jgi:hypothetical protein
MSAAPMTCAEVRELSPEFSLGILSGAERAEVVMHLNGCARCQALVTELTEAADVIPQLVPEVEPPVGFEARVLRRLGADERRIRRRWVAAVAAVAAAAMIVSVTVVRVIEANDDTPTAARVTTTVGAAPVAVAMDGGVTDAAAGWAYVSGGHGVAIAVDYGIPSGTYGIRVQPAHRQATSIGTMRVEAGRGSWTGSSDDHLGAGARIALVDASGNEVCHGTVPIAE